MKSKTKPRTDSRSERGNICCNDLHPSPGRKFTVYSTKNQVVESGLASSSVNSERNGGNHE
jgi:hypothetical protein